MQTSRLGLVLNDGLADLCGSSVVATGRESDIDDAEQDAG
jgi:hypothetical protein